MKKNYETILFDLDGTLTDPKVGITKSVAYALNAYGIAVEDLDSLCPFIGPPLKDSFMEFYGFSADKAMEAIGKYREYFSVHGLFENELYEGIKEVLQQLQASGKRLAVATSKPEPFAIEILDYFGLSEYFEVIAGSKMDETRTTKGEVIAHALEQLGNPAVSQILMVGDRKHDCMGAAQFGMDCLGVLYGYGSEEELNAAGAVDLVATVAELGEYFK